AALRMWPLACMATCVMINVLAQDLPSSTPDAKQAMEYLQKFGYISNGRFKVENEMEKAIRYCGIFVSVVIRTTLKSLVAKCMIEQCTAQCCDIALDKPTASCFVSGGRWRKTTLAYHFLNLTPDLKGNEVKKIIARAFHEWSRVTPLRFYETPTSPKADIHIQFSRLQHGDFAPFDGPGRVLAHAYFPEDGRAHFDEDEQWSEGTAQGINLHIVATHEFGHLLGLGHSKEQAALMAPFYMGYRPKFRLHADDIAGIQSLYGTRLVFPREAPSRSLFMTRSACTPIKKNTHICVGTGPDGRTYAFSGAYCWVVTDTGVQQGYPVATSSLWSGLPASLSAAAHSKHTGHTFFFAGDKYWRYRGFASDPGYPKMMSSTGLPSNVDAALMFRDRIYVFKGGEYWRWNEYHEQAVHGYPRKMATTWRGVPSSPDAALTWGNGHSFFFKDGRYWRINSHSRRTEPGYPRDTAAVWM
uniref:Matrix metallopeptidase 19 n=1 Tax=Petromyzon marinus TaxID=7757 RepID=S4RAE0_PETMA